MPRIMSHGGGCCGARHLASFTGPEAQCLASFEQAMAEAPQGRLIEVILNEGQCRQYPRVLQKMADYGFVLVGSWINSNHNSRLYCWHRADRRRRLDQLGRNIQWNGQVIDPTMRGDLPRVEAKPRAHVNYEIALRQWENWRPPLGITYGSRVRVNSPRSKRHGREYTVIRTYHAYYRNSGGWVMQDENGIEFKIARHNLILVNQNERPPRPVPPPGYGEEIAIAPARHEVG